MISYILKDKLFCTIVMSFTEIFSKIEKYLKCYFFLVILL